MDIVLRAQHDQLVQEFLCSATELRLVHTPQGSDWTRAMEAFCSDRRAERFGSRLSDFQSCCVPCHDTSVRDSSDDTSVRDSSDDTKPPDDPGVDEVRESA